MNRFIHRHQPKMTAMKALIAGIGAAIAIGVTGGLTDLTTVALLMAPFGASCVLLFSVPAVPLSQPANVIGGHVLAAAIGLAFRAFLPNVWWAAAIAVGTAIGLMAALRVTHPPAGANPLVVFALDPELEFLLTPVLSGAVLLVAIATLYHKATGVVYPLVVKKD